MSTFDTTKWYRTDWGTEYLPVVVDPDADGFIPVMGRSGAYNLMRSGFLTPIPERHTVEWRVPKVGERYIGYYGDIITVHGTTTIAAWVVVEDEVTS